MSCSLFDVNIKFNKLFRILTEFFSNIESFDSNLSDSVRSFLIFSFEIKKLK
jgi:hypothetical protein